MAKKDKPSDFLEDVLDDVADVLSLDVLAELGGGDVEGADADGADDGVAAAVLPEFLGVTDEGDAFGFDGDGSDATATGDGASDTVEGTDGGPGRAFEVRPGSSFDDATGDDAFVFDASASDLTPDEDSSRSSSSYYHGGDDVVIAAAASETIRTHKGDDHIDAGAGDDLVVAGHGDDVLDGGSGDDVLNGGKGDDVLVYTLSENRGGNDYYDGGKGFDTLELRLTFDEFAELQDELASLKDWIAEHQFVKASSGVKFNDASVNGAEKHAVFETSFGLDIRYIENLKVMVEEFGELDPYEPLPEIETEPEPIVIDVVDVASSEEPVDVALAPGSSTTITVNVEVKDTPPMYDVFMVQDLSGSFYDDLLNVKSLFPSLMETLGAENDVAFGVGSFVDKPYDVFGFSGFPEYGIEGDYVYRTDHAVTTDLESVQAAMDALRTYSGFDYPESQLEALVQVALRGSEVGFRDGAQKYVVLSTDAVFHKAGDFETHDGAAVPENDYDTDLELEDYPDMTAVGDLLKAAGITPVFAVTASVMPTYQALVDAWGFGSVVELAADSSNIADAITSGIGDTSFDLKLDISGDDYGYITAITPEVYPDAEPGSYTFEITLEVPDDTTSLGSDALSVSIPGYGTLALDVVIDGMDMTGDAGDNVLIGNDGDNVIDGQEGNDTLTGGAGDDTFVFATGSGRDTVTDFADGDVLDLRRVATVASVAEVLAAASQVGDDTVFDFGSDDVLVLEGTDVSSLQAEDFVL